MKIQHHRIDTNVVVGLLVREFRCSGTDVSAKVLAMYAGTRTSSMEPQWLAAGLSQDRLKDVGGKILLVGVGHERNTYIQYCSSHHWNSGFFYADLTQRQATGVPLTEF